MLKSGCSRPIVTVYSVPSELAETNSLSTWKTPLTDAKTRPKNVKMLPTRTRVS